MQSVSRENQQNDLSPRCYVGFSIAGSSLDLDGISETLNQKSAETGRAGMETAVGVLTEDCWKMTSPLTPLKLLDEHLQWLREQLEPHVDYLRDLSRTAHLGVYIGFTLSQEQNGFVISPDFVRLFASFNASIDMYILCIFGDDLDEAKELATQT